MAIRALKPVRTAGTGGVVSVIASAVTGYGTYVVRTGTRTGASAAGPDVSNGIGFALDNGTRKTHDGFYSVGDVMPVATSGTVYALVMTQADTDIVQGDFLEVADLSSAISGDNTLPVGVLEEAGNSEGNIKTLTSVAQAMEDKTLGSSSYTDTFDDVDVGDTQITGINTGTLGLAVGDYIILRQVEGDSQLNRVKTLTENTIGLEIPASVALVKNTDKVHRVAQILVKIL